MDCHDLNLLELKIKSILEWSAMDLTTKSVLQAISKEVFTTLRQSDKK